MSLAHSSGLRRSRILRSILCVSCASVLVVSHIALQADLDVTIDNLLDAFVDIDPLKIVQKPKLHLLKHLPECIRRFGPSVRFATENFESYNSVFRLCSILSNHHAPSRDIAQKFCGMERVKHIVSTGFWFEDDRLKTVGSGIAKLTASQPMLTQYLGWVTPKPTKIGQDIIPNIYVSGMQLTSPQVLHERALKHLACGRVQPPPAHTRNSRTRPISRVLDCSQISHNSIWRRCRGWKLDLCCGCRCECFSTVSNSLRFTVHRRMQFGVASPRSCVSMASTRFL